MKILAIDTSCRYCCIGVSDRDTLYEYSVQLQKKLSTFLVPSIQRVLEALGWDARDVDYFACCLGPGSFTGVRIGVSAMKAMSWALRKPIVGFSSLAAIARNDPGRNGFVVPVCDAKRNLIYCGIYRWRKDTLSSVTPDKLLSFDAMAALVKKNTHGSVTFVGDAVGLYKERIAFECKHAVLLDKDHWYPKPRHILMIVKEKIARKQIEDPVKIKPVYLYPKECQVREVKG
jgi:tRNA threonylcarbamoyladenosine biosynthesis protein TsaB